LEVDTLLLDAGGVLVRPHWDRVASVLAALGIAADAGRLDAAELHVLRELDDPAIIRRTDDASRLVAFVRRCLEIAGVPEQDRDRAVTAVKAAHDAENLWDTVPPEVPGALARLRARARRMVVVSNANGTVRAKLERVGLSGWFDLIVDSAEEGVEKPDPRIFRTALARVGSAPERALHVGDLYGIDVVGARAAGVRAILLDRAGLYAGFDVDRVRDLGDLAERYEALVTTPRS
jgi:putative hydrolase of the HAD superfamily